MTIAPLQLQWRPTTAGRVQRYDDIWFFDENVGWAVNSDGKILHTSDGGGHWQEQFHDSNVYLRCVGFVNALRGWVGTTTPANRLYETSDGGATWSPVTNLPVSSPAFICGLSVVNASVIYGSGTNDPSNSPAIIKSTDGGLTWASQDMREHASLLVDIYFPEPNRGWVVGGKADRPNPTSRSRVKPVVLFTEDGGQTWKNQLASLEPTLPSGEWGWKIFFVDANVGFVSLENFAAGAVLKTADGGITWNRMAINDTQHNANLEGIGFIDENHGWVGGWGDRSFQGGFTSETLNGGRDWQNANTIGRFLNRFRFFGKPVTVGYASGDTIYKYSVASPADTFAPTPPVAKFLSTPISEESKLPLEITYTVPDGTKRLEVNIWNHFGVHIRKVVEQTHPRPGTASVYWNGESDSGEQLPVDYYIYRVSINDDSESAIVRVVPASSPSEMQRLNAIAQRSPAVNRPTSFKLHIRPMFQEIDVQHMAHVGPASIDLTNYETVKAKAPQILARLKDPDDPMPPTADDGPWPGEWIALFERWIAEGTPA
jgi:photosystem II stability/assembly factor-like uncharacterized protein